MAPAPAPRLTVRRRRASASPAVVGGSILPGELRPLAETPASSDSGDGPTFTEAQLLYMLIRHYRWVWVGKDHLQRYNPHGRKVREEVEALCNG